MWTNEENSKTNHGDTEAVNKPSMTNFHKFSGDSKCIPTSQRSFIGHLNDKFFVAKPSYSFDSGFIHSFTEARRKSQLCLQCARNRIHPSARKVQRLTTEHREKVEVAEKYVEERENATKLDLVFFAGKEGFYG